MSLLVKQPYRPSSERVGDYTFECLTKAQLRAALVSAGDWDEIHAVGDLGDVLPQDNWPRMMPNEHLRVQGDYDPAASTPWQPRPSTRIRQHPSLYGKDFGLFTFRNAFDIDRLDLDVDGGIIGRTGGAYGTLFSAWYSRYIRTMRCRIHHAGTIGAIDHGSYHRGSDEILDEGNEIHDISNYPLLAAAGIYEQPDTHGETVHHWTARRNYIHDVGRESPQLGPAAMWGHGMATNGAVRGSCHDIIWEDNLVERASDAFVMRYGRDNLIRRFTARDIAQRGEGQAFTFFACDQGKVEFSDFSATRVGSGAGRGVYLHMSAGPYRNLYLHDGVILDAQYSAMDLHDCSDIFVERVNVPRGAGISLTNGTATFADVTAPYGPTGPNATRWNCSWAANTVPVKPQPPVWDWTGVGADIPGLEPVTAPWRFPVSPLVGRLRGRRVA